VEVSLNKPQLDLTFWLGVESSYGPYFPPRGKPLGGPHPSYIGAFIGRTYPIPGQIPQVGLIQHILSKPLIGALFPRIGGIFWNPDFGCVPHFPFGQTTQVTPQVSAYQPVQTIGQTIPRTPLSHPILSTPHTPVQKHVMITQTVVQKPIMSTLQTLVQQHVPPTPKKIVQTAQQMTIQP